MALKHGTRVLGERHVVQVKAGSAIAANDLIATTEATGSNTVDNAATNAAVFGFALEAISSGSTGLADRIRPGDQFWVYVSSGTVSAATVGKFVDIVDELSVTLTSSNNDARVVGWDGVTTDHCIVEFTTPESATPTVLA